MKSFETDVAKCWFFSKLQIIHLVPLSVNHLSIVILKELTAEGREREQLTDTSVTAGQGFAAKEEDSMDKMSKV